MSSQPKHHPKQPHKSVDRRQNKPGHPAASLSKTDFLSKYGNFLIIAGLLIVTYLVFSNSLHGKFLSWDDNVYVTGNKDIHGLGLSNLKMFFSNYYCGNFQPLTIFSYALEYAVAGTRSTFLYHFDNLLLHLINVLLVFFLIRLFIKNSWVAALTALLFAIHPLRVESVSWISERKDVLYACFFLLSLISYHFYLRPLTPSPPRPLFYYALVTLFFLLSGLSKSAATVLPLVLFLMDYLYRRKISWMLFLEKIPLLAIALIFGILALKSQGTAIQDVPFFTVWQKILLVNYSFWRYVFMTFIPVGLSAYHPYPEHPGGVLPMIYYIAPLFTIILIASCIYSIRYGRYFVFACLFFFITIALVLQALPVGGASIAERYSYIPHVGVFLILSLGIVKLWELKTAFQPYFRVALVAVLAISLTGLSLVTHARNRVWNDSISLWEDIAEKYPKVMFIYHNIAMTYKDQGNSDKAFDWYSRVIYQFPSDDEAYVNRGNIYLARGNDSLAMADYNRAITINPKPKSAEAYSNRGSLFSRINKYDNAMADFDKAITIDPKLADIYLNRAITYGALGQLGQALKDWDTYITLKPRHFAAYNDRAIVKQGLKMHHEAIQDLDIAIKEKPEEGIYYLNRSISYFNLGDKNNARIDAQNAIKFGVKVQENYLQAIK
jgi:protein O-mannosyl-transferase